MREPITVEESWYDGPVYIVNVPPTEDGRIGESFHIYGDEDARAILAALRQGSREAGDHRYRRGARRIMSE